ncbi:MAG: HU family DNA-binding protein [Alistipes sp.]|nr:HU family DNA-binding protein [Alistipes sp.]MDE6857732.1 HU family DNA-binding protein [Alistipes sp.]
MNKTQLVEAISLDAGISRVEASKALDSFLKIAARTLKEEDKIVLQGFGAFSVQHKPARTGRNPRTGAPVKIAPKRVVKFHPTVELDD